MYVQHQNFASPSYFSRPMFFQIHTGNCVNIFLNAWKLIELVSYRGGGDFHAKAIFQNGLGWLCPVSPAQRDMTYRSVRNVLFT